MAFDAPDKGLFDLNAHVDALLSTQPDTLSRWLDALPAMQALLHPSELGAWSESVIDLARLSEDLAASYMGASTHVAAQIDAAGLDRWTDTGRQIASLGWKSTDLACRYFDACAGASAETFDSLERLGRVLRDIARTNVELATTCLDAAGQIFEMLAPGNHPAFLALAEFVAGHRRAEIWPLFEWGGHLLRVFSPADAGRLANMAITILGDSPETSPGLLREILAALGSLDPAEHDRWLVRAESIAALDAPAAGEFLVSATVLCDALSTQGVDAWIQQGMDLARETPSDTRAAACRAFFRVESGAANEALTRLSGRVEFGQVAHLLQLYGEATAGEDVRVRPAAAANVLARREHHDQDVYDIVVPAFFDAFESRQANLDAYKVCIAHQAGRRQFGSFDEFGKGETHLPDAARIGHLSRDAFFAGFDDRPLITRLFVLAEDYRVDARVQEEYPGLVDAMGRVKHRAARTRPRPDTLALRQAFIENLLHVSLDTMDTTRWPESMGNLMATTIGVLCIARNAHTSVQDTAAIAGWLYDLAHAIPNVTPGEMRETWRSMTGIRIPALDRLPPLPSVPAELHSRPQCVLELTPSPDFRGAFSPVEPGSLRHAKPRTEPDPATAQRLAEKATNAEGDSLPQLRLPETQGVEPAEAQGEARGPTPAAGDILSSCTYDEWDFRSNGYRRAWCRVNERRTAEGTTTSYENILSRHHGLVRAIRKQFEMMRPENQRKVRNLHDGHDIDLEQAIRFIVEKKAGAGPAARFYTRRDKIERSVTAAFLLDLSHSTSEPVADSEERIIDIERDAAVLLIEALEAIGDTYGLFGFSGHGRQDVSFYAIKDLDESFGETIKRRIDSLAPIGATRMGAAIRHTCTRLAACASAVKLLLLISDGRPQDQEYGDEDDAQSYGIHDTRQALVEAKRAGITPFLITVDRQGPDYLEALCGDMGYEIIRDVTSLPGRMPAIYRYLAGN